MQRSNGTKDSRVGSVSEGSCRCHRVARDAVSGLRLRGRILLGKGLWEGTCLEGIPGRNCYRCCF